MDRIKFCEGLEPDLKRDLGEKVSRVGAVFELYFDGG